MPDTAALLRGVPLFNELTEHDLERIARVAVPRSYPAGTVILREGDPGDTCYVLRGGRARVTRQHADGRSITLTNLGPGEIFGELAMFGGEVRSATVEAVDEVRAVALLAADLKRLLSEHPEIAVKLLGALSGRLREANARISRQSFQKVSSPSRLSALICITRGRQGSGEWAVVVAWAVVSAWAPWGWSSCACWRP